MKKQLMLFIAVLLSVVISMGCGPSGSDIRISISGTPELHEQKFVSDSETASFYGTISVIGSADLKVLSAEGNELYRETFEDVRKHDLSIEVQGLTPGNEYVLLLDGTDTVSCTLTLSTDQKLTAGISAPADSGAAEQ
ncbi:hypothetical protein [Christensenella tenuis]|jgi:hypothetical protein|uniref:Lipoprotein n=1 Tax=Christensenella tenuis TaxID=2763033 RepID=A0ABR7EHP7_9FIRM|nr:hypothetical protein [Christensenella tenuis]MBC5649286.1 hypothetical protein [Christensenella tenuis]